MFIECRFEDSKVLADCLKKYSPFLISSDQTAYSGRRKTFFRYLESNRLKVFKQIETVTSNSEYSEGIWYC